MTNKTIALLLIGLTATTGLIGCGSCRPRLCQGRLFKRFRQPRTQPTAVQVPPGTQYPGPPPSSQFPTQPPSGQIPTQPPGVPNIGEGSANRVIPPPVIPGASQYGPKQVDYRWVPSETQAKQPVPLPPKKSEKPPSARLIPPIFPPEKKPEQPEPKTAEPKKKEEPKKDDVSPFPVGIPQFSPVREGLATGLRPLLDDGLDWLKDAGYETVLHVRRTGEADAGDKQQVEKRGMKYVALEVAPDKLSEEIVEQFNKLVSDSDARPMFVYDRDGSLAGGLWYLHFRTHEQVSDEVARIRVSGLGFHENQPGSHQDMWRAIQKYMADQKN